MRDNRGPGARPRADHRPDVNARMPSAPCPCCGATPVPGLRPWHVRCPACGYEASDFVPAIGAPPGTAGTALDEAGREEALGPLRRANAARLLELLGSRLPRGAALLDVGCAHGWFLEAAGRDYAALGIEPDAAVAGPARSRGLPVRPGLFPDALAGDERFDAIVFNDVFEHLTDLHAALRACHRHLREGGWLVLNLPNADGLYYRWARRLARIGIDGPFRRLWQAGMPSPHLHYFTPGALRRLVEPHGYALELQAGLPAVSAAGLVERVRYARSGSALADAAGLLGAAALLPFARIATSDAMVLLFRRR